MDFYELFLNKNDNKLSSLKHFSLDYNKLDVKKFNKSLKENSTQTITLFFPFEIIKIEDVIYKGIGSRNLEQESLLYTDFFSAKVYSGLYSQDFIFIAKVDVEISKLSIDKNRIQEAKVNFPNIGNTLADSLIGGHCVKHKGKIYIDKIKSLIFIDTKGELTKEFNFEMKHREESISKINKIIENIYENK